MMDMAVENAHVVDSFCRGAADALAAGIEGGGNILSARRKSALRSSAVAYCAAAGLIDFVSRPAFCQALVVLARRCGKSPKLATIATYDQLVEGEPVSHTTMRRAVREARALGWVRVEYEKVSSDMNKPNLFVLVHPYLKRLAGYALGRSIDDARFFSKGSPERDDPGLVNNNNLSTNTPTSQHSRAKRDKVGGQKGRRVHRHAGQAGDAARRGRPRHRPGQTEPSQPDRAGHSGPSNGFEGSKRPGRYSPLSRCSMDELVALTGRGLQALAGASWEALGGMPKTEKEAIERADQVRRELQVPIAKADLERGARATGIWSALAFAETAIKWRTHTRKPIRDFTAYWGMITFNPYTDRDPLDSVMATIEGHAASCAALEIPEARPPGERPPAKLNRVWVGMMRRAARLYRAVPEDRRHLVTGSEDWARNADGFKDPVWQAGKEVSGMLRMLDTKPNVPAGAAELWRKHFMDNLQTDPFPEPPEIPWE